MRRRYHKNYKKIKFIYIIFIFFIFIGVSYSYLTTSLNITGNVGGSYVTGDFNIDPKSNPNITISQLSLNKWQENDQFFYQYRFIIKNIGSIDYDNFQALFSFNNKIGMSNIWNYSYSIDNNKLSVINTTYDLLAGKTLEIGFIITSNKATLSLNTVKIDATTGGNVIDPSKFLVVFEKTSEWGNYVYQYNVNLTNKTGQRITYWQLDVTLPEGTSYQSGWNAIFTSNENILTIKNTTYNGRIDNNKSTTFGIQISTNIVNFIPSNIKITVR